MIDLTEEFKEKQFFLLQGDCLEKMKLLPDNSIDSIVTDPPYGLSDHGETDVRDCMHKWLDGQEYTHDKKGFMNKTWDSWVPSPLVWKEVYRVLKPGGYICCFASTRTDDLMSMSLRLAGFRKHPFIGWVFGCYSEDTECFTDSGWKLYQDINIGVDRILQWDANTDSFTWYLPTEVLVYDAPERMVHFKNRHTDQLLTENHRVYLKHRTNSRYSYSDYDVVNANEVKKSWCKVFPLASNLSDGIHEPRAYMIGWWVTDAWKHKDGKAIMFSQSKIPTMNKLRDFLSKENCNFSEYIKVHKNTNHKDEHTFYVTGELANFMLDNYPTRSLTWDIMKFDFDSRISLLEGLLDGDGSRSSTQHAETFWSKKSEFLDIVSALCSSVGVRNHIDYVKGCVYLNRKCGTTEFQNRHTVETVDYTGKNVWCMKTETGAFLVRRNGRPFISGNSGFPKAANLSKAIDKHFGVDQEFTPIGNSVKRLIPGATQNLTGSWIKDNGREYQPGISSPTSEKAKKWDGWYYGLQSLKPALEPILMFQKPVEGKMIDNVLEHGTGGVNIDGCRVPTDDKLGGGNNCAETDLTGKHEGWSRPWMADEKARKAAADRSITSTQKSESLGRFPANLIHDGSYEVVALFPDSNGAGKSLPNVKITGYGDKNTGTGSSEYFGGDRIPFDAGSGTAARFFKQCKYEEGDYDVIKYCAKTSRKERNEGLDDFPKSISKSVGNGMSNVVRRCPEHNTSIPSGGRTYSCGCKFIYSDEDVSHPTANNHPTVKPHELMQYLCTLITPPNGIILDPFNGSGSTGKAAVSLGFKYIGCELDENYIEISNARIQYEIDNKHVVKKQTKKSKNIPKEQSVSILDSLFE